MSQTEVEDVAALRARIRAGGSFQYRLFWGHRPRKGGQLSDACFSQWWPAPFAVEGVSYSSAEQFMMAEKARVFGDEAVRKDILGTADPSTVKALGRRVSGFDEAKWAGVRFDIVTSASVAKFGQDERLRTYLVETGDAVLVEASPTDAVWGIGLAAEHAEARNPDAWRGENLLGFALMRARAKLRPR